MGTEVAELTLLENSSNVDIAWSSGNLGFADNSVKTFSTYFALLLSENCLMSSSRSATYFCLEGEGRDGRVRGQ